MAALIECEESLNELGYVEIVSVLSYGNKHMLTDGETYYDYKLTHTKTQDSVVIGIKLQLLPINKYNDILSNSYNTVDVSTYNELTKYLSKKYNKIDTLEDYYIIQGIDKYDNTLVAINKLYIIAESTKIKSAYNDKTYDDIKKYLVCELPDGDLRELYMVDNNFIIGDIYCHIDNIGNIYNIVEEIVDIDISIIMNLIKEVNKNGK